jgi:hypothetical protein
MFLSTASFPFFTVMYVYQEDLEEIVTYKEIKEHSYIVSCTGF